MNMRNLLNNFFSIINIAAAFFYFISQSQLLWILLAIQIVIVVYFLKYNPVYFVHSLFWPVFLISLLVFPWPLSFILPIIIYLSVIIFTDKSEYRIHWLKAGSLNRNTIMIMIPTILLSSAALIIWVIVLKPDLSDLKNMVPSDSVSGIIIIGILFSVFNSLWEEIILKGILWNGLEIFISSALLINLFQAVLFGVMHFNGFPRGIIGAVLAGIYGLLIGFIRKYSNGLLAPVITHFFADAVIFGILVFLQM